MRNAVNLYITEIGSVIRVPDEVIKGVVFGRGYRPDRRMRCNREYLEWCERQEKASIEAWKRGDDYLNM